MLILSANSLFAAALTDTELGRYLTSIHDVDWKTLTERYSQNPQALKNRLALIIANPQKELPQLDGFQNRFAWENAIRGYGHLADRNSKGNLSSSEVKYYQQIQTRVEKYEDNYGKIALIESLKNTGTADALRMLGKMAQEENELWLSTKALDAASKILEGETSLGAQGDLAYVPFYYPNLKENFSVRETTDWPEHIEELLTIEEKIKALYNFKNSKEIHPSMEKYFQNLEEKFMKSLEAAKVAMANSENKDQTPVLLASAGEGEQEKDFGTLGQTIGKFSHDVAEEKSELAQKIDENKNVNEVNPEQMQRGIASEQDQGPNPDAPSPSTPNYMLFGLIGVLFLVMAYVGIKFSKKKK